MSGFGLGKLTIGRATRPRGERLRALPEVHATSASMRGLMPCTGRRGTMTRTLLMAASTGLIATFALGGAASADPGDQWKKQWEKRAECDKKLYEAKSARDFHKKA